MAGVEIEGIKDWYKLLDTQALIHVAPGVLIGFALFVIVRRYKSILTFPSCMISIVMCFYALLLVLG